MVCGRLQIDKIHKNSACDYYNSGVYRKGKRKVQGVPQLHAAALPSHQEEEEPYKTKEVQIEQTYEKH